MFNEVAPQRTADAVFDQVRDQIVGGALVAGEALPGERELAAQLGVSRGVVREALQRLSQAGLIDIRHGGATRIRDFDANHIIVRRYLGAYLTAIIANSLDCVNEKIVKYRPQKFRVAQY